MVAKLIKPVNTKHKAQFSNFIAIVFALVAGLFVLRASYPGYLNADSVHQLTQIITGKYNDWQSPFATLVWAGLDSFMPGPFGFVVLVNVLVWGSIVIMICLSSRRFGYASLLLLAIPFMPGAINLLGNVHKDVLLTGWLLSASVFGYLANRDDLSNGKRLVFLFAANLLLIAAFLTRLNAIFAILPLLVYANHGLGRRRGLLAGALVLALMPLFHVAVQKMTEADKTYPGESIKVFHLLGLSYLEGKNLFPGKWTDEQSKKIVEACYTPVQWDTAAFWGKCGFIHKELGRQQIWNSEALTHSWIKNILKNPHGFFTIMSATFYKSLYFPNSRSMFYNPEKTKLVNWEVKMNPPRITTGLMHGFVSSRLNDRLGRPIVFAIIAILGLGLLVCFRSEITDLELFAIALMGSGLINVLSYFCVTVSAEYRYFYWSSFAIYLGLALSLISMLFREDGQLKQPISITFKMILFSLVSIAVGLVAASGDLPAGERQIRVTAMDMKGVSVKKMRKASTPDWMAHTVEGVMTSRDWALDKNGYYRGTGSDGVLEINLPTHGLAVEVVFATGPDEGRALIESEGFKHVVDLSSSSVGSKTLYMKPSSADVIKRGELLWMRPLWAVLWGLVSFLILYWLSVRIKPVRTTAELAVRTRQLQG